jgi:hypothetical protein
VLLYRFARALLLMRSNYSQIDESSSSAISLRSYVNCIVEVDWAGVSRSTRRTWDQTDYVGTERSALSRVECCNPWENLLSVYGVSTFVPD